MGYMCDFCGEQRSMVYCRSDAACLCLSCDRNVHSANSLSKRHSRTLLCERCILQPAVVRCAEEKVSLCQDCDWMSHGTTGLGLTHKRQRISCYSGCPSASEFSSLWSFVLELPSVEEASCELELGLMTIAENSAKNSWEFQENSTSQVVDPATESDKYNSCIGSSSVPECQTTVNDLEQPGRSENPSLSKPSNIYCREPKVAGLSEDVDLYDDLIMDELDLNLESYEELFGVTLNQSEELFRNGGMDSLFASKDISAADSSCQGAIAAEGSSVVLFSSIQPASSNAASTDLTMSAKTEPMLYYTGKQNHSSLSFSGLAGESNTGDHQDCGTSSILLMGEPPWCPPRPESSCQSATRNNAVMRYKEKKKSRKFEKKVRYASRKARADIRKRVKGRFVKAGDSYDYDPLSQTKSY